MSVLRLFVALVPCAAHRARLAEEARRWAALEPSARAVAAENLHGTVAFLGAVVGAEADAVAAVVRRVAARHPPFSVTIAGLGAFPSPERPRVVWAGLDAAGDGAARMAAIARDLASALAEAGHPVDAAERFHAHVTLARVHGPGCSEALEKALTTGTLQGTYTPEVLSDLLLMVSENDGRGVRYRPLATVPLTGQPGARDGRTGETAAGAPASS